jgi:hypothetical protein
MSPHRATDREGECASALRRSFSSRKPANCANAANSWIPASEWAIQDSDLIPPGSETRPPMIASTAASLGASVDLIPHVTVGVQVQRVGQIAIKRGLPAIDPGEMPQPRSQLDVRRKRLRVRFAVKRPRLSRAATARGSPPDPPTDLAGLGFASVDIHGLAELKRPAVTLNVPAPRGARSTAAN